MTRRELYELTGHVILSTFNVSKYDKEVSRKEILEFLESRAVGGIDYNKLDPKIVAALELKRA